MRGKIDMTISSHVLVKEEPYKWETLYRSTLDKLIRGDKSYIKALSFLLSMIKRNERDKTISELRDIGLICKEDINLIGGSNNKESKIKKLYSYIIILTFIFTNRYDLVIKGKRKKIYERTGYLMYQLRKLIK
tara:strand:- start:19 stop:417 length:399 start_codon:yes stop_codon:yes gene_type:complete